MVKGLSSGLSAAKLMGSNPISYKFFLAFSRLDACVHSSMVEWVPSKHLTRVRFPMNANSSLRPGMKSRADLKGRLLEIESNFEN